MNTGSTYQPMDQEFKSFPYLEVVFSLLQMLIFFHQSKKVEDQQIFRNEIIIFYIAKETIKILGSKKFTDRLNQKAYSLHCTNQETENADLLTIKRQIFGLFSSNYTLKFFKKKLVITSTKKSIYPMTSELR
uniref:Uncharacterized protein n=1 Tax=Romanomermis culicivorax TaxID=13658 RepID=A0A915HEJ4_ROMCU